MQPKQNHQISYDEVKKRVRSHRLEDNGDGVVLCHRCRRIWLDLSQVWHSGMCGKDEIPAG